MTDKPTFRRSVTSTTRTWQSLEDIPPEQRAVIKKMLGDNQLDDSVLDHEWGRKASGAADKAGYTIEIVNGVITVNGRKYDSVDAVPEPQRQRVRALMHGVGAEGTLMDLFKDSTFEPPSAAGGVDSTADVRSGVGSPADVRVGDAMAGSAAMGNGDGSVASPGAVPPSRSGRLLGLALLAVLCAGLAWLAARWLQLV